MKFSLPAMVRRARPGLRRRRIVLRDIRPPAVLATDLYRACYLPVIEAWEQAAEPIMAEYTRSLAQLTTDSALDLTAILDGIETGLQRIVLDLLPELRRWSLRLEGWQRGKWRGALLSATGVDVGTMLGPEDMRETLETAVARNVGLIKDVSAQARGRIADAVFRGLNQRLPARDVAAEIRQAVDMSRRRARNIAAHQLSDVSNRLADERRREAGISKWQWKHSGKLHYRPEHRARDGKVYADTAAGASPPDVLPPPEDRPGALPFCGCRSLSVLDF